MDGVYNYLDKGHITKNQVNKQREWTGQEYTPNASEMTEMAENWKTTIFQKSRNHQAVQNVAIPVQDNAP